MRSMLTDAIELALAQGQKALREARTSDALAAFKTADTGDTADPRICMGLAIASRALGDYEVCLNAIDRFLTQDKSQPIALVIRGDALKGLGKQRQAVSAYMAALQAVPPNGDLDPNTRAELQRAQAECNAARGLYEAYLRKHVRNRLGSDIGREGTRSGQTLDLIFGRKQVYHQQPFRFYFPELPQRQFYDRDEFDWTESIEASSEAIKTEFAALAEQEDRFAAYVASDGREPHLRQHALTDNRDWSAIHLIRNGERFEDNIDRAPETMAALAQAPIPDVINQSPSALFSRLLPGAHIPPHNGLTNTRLICHLPLVLPGECTLRVGNQTRSWRDGELLIFDDSIEHEARNGSRAARSVLIFDVWRPELSEDDRNLVRAIFAGIDAFGT